MTKFIYMHMCIHTHTHTHTHTHSFLHSFSQDIDMAWVPVLHTRTLLYIHSIYNSLHLLIPNSQSTLPHTWSLSPNTLCPCVCFCLVDKLICVMFYISHIRHSIWHLSFSFWLTSLSMIISRSIISLFFMAEEYSTIYMNHIFFIHSPKDGRLDCFHILLLWIVLLWTYRCIYLFELQFCLNMCLGVGLLHHMATLFFNFLRNLDKVFHGGYTNLY